MREPKTTKIDYTLEQFLAERLEIDRIIQTLEKMSKLQEKFLIAQIKHDNRIVKLQAKIKKLEARLGKK